MSDLKSVIDQIDRLSLIAGAELHRLNGSVFSEKKKKGAPISNWPGLLLLRPLLFFFPSDNGADGEKNCQQCLQTAIPS